VQLYLAGQNVSEGGECIVEGLVVNALVQVLDEDVADARLADGRIPLRPHDAAWPAFDCIKVHRVQSTLSCKTHHPKSLL